MKNRLKPTSIELKKRVKPGEAILCFWGYGHQPAIKKHEKTVVEKDLKKRLKPTSLELKN